MDEYTDIPLDGWAFRLSRWWTSGGEELVGSWHRTKYWFRRGGVWAGLMAHCGRTYTDAHIELVGAPDQHPVGTLCQECFGTDHSDKLTG